MRRAAVTVSIKGHDVTLDLMPYLVSLTYTDKADEELDDLQIVLEDREGIWQGDWLPQTGDVIEASWAALSDSIEYKLVSEGEAAPAV